MKTFYNFCMLLFIGLQLKAQEPCGKLTVKDYDGNVYHTVQIGKQCWMKENLRTTHYANGTEILLGNSTSDLIAYRYYPNNDVYNVRLYGYLYNWIAVMQGNQYETNSHMVQGICPHGWHLPSKTDFKNICDFCNKEYYYGKDNPENGLGVAKALLDIESWLVNSEAFPVIYNYPGMDNRSNFSALAAGYYLGYYSHFGMAAHFWSSTVWNAEEAYHLAIGSGISLKTWYKEAALSVRCLRN